MELGTQLDTGDERLVGPKQLGGGDGKRRQREVGSLLGGHDRARDAAGTDFDECVGGVPSATEGRLGQDPAAVVVEGCGKHVGYGRESRRELGVTFGRRGEDEVDHDA